jgi:hypothetical protein
VSGSFGSVSYAQKIAAKPARDVDSLIKDIADNKNAKDYAEFLSLLPNLRLFLPLVGPLPEGFTRGQKITVQDGMEIKARTVSVQSLELILVFTSATNSKLGADYAEIEGREALQMVIKSRAIDGLLVQSSSTAWVAVERDKISDVLSTLPK